MNKYVDKDGLQYFAEELTAKNKEIFAVKAEVGTPLVAATAAAMTDTSKIYVYTGSETGYTAGAWYYYDGSDWQSGGVYNSVAVQTDTSLSVSGMAADAKTVGDDLDALDGRLDAIEDDYVTESEMTAAISANLDATLSVSGDAADAKSAGDGINAVKNAIIIYDAISYTTYANSWRLNKDDGLCSLDASYKLVKYAVKAGDYLKIVSDDRFQFQTVAAVPDTGASNRVGITYSTGEYFLQVPSTATYLIMSTPINDSTAKVYKAITDAITGYGGKYTWDDGTTRDLPNVLNQASYLYWASVLVECSEGDVFSLIGDGGNNSRLWIFADETGASIEASATYTRYSEYTVIVAPAGTKYLACNSHTNVAGLTPSLIKGFFVPDEIVKIESNLDFNVPLIKWRNGSIHSIYNTDYIAMYETIKTYNVEQISVAIGFSPSTGNHFRVMFTTLDDDMNNVRYDNTVDFSGGSVSIPISVLESYIQIAITEVDDSGAITPLRVDTTDTDKIKVIVNYYKNYNTRFNNIAVKNARHIPNSAATPLTLLHFSDIHQDASALKRILYDAKRFNSNIDDIICTGDMRLTDGGAIDSWWDENVMTCVGNHDSAVYSNNTYDWTAVSMANRDAYYIAPFESNWGIVHTSGTSYYYKDYSTQKVRLIVMDGMLYISNGEEATAQTTWLENLLDDAITNNLHVLIAIHAGHGGATIKQCSFSQLGASTYPTYADCNTPQTVVDSVASKISAGLKFIGYIVGHEHKDYILDAENDGKQLFYLITCAMTSASSAWTKSDMYRGADADAYNIVTIDTANTLVKIIRCGGADIDDHMRPRKAICFDYSTGEIVGETL